MQFHKTQIKLLHSDSFSEILLCPSTSLSISGFYSLKWIESIYVLIHIKSTVKCNQWYFFHHHFVFSNLMRNSLKLDLSWKTFELVAKLVLDFIVFTNAMLSILLIALTITWFIRTMWWMRQPEYILRHRFLHTFCNYRKPYSANQTDYVYVMPRQNRSH